MTKSIGYIGVVSVVITKETYDDVAYAIGSDPANEVCGFEYECKDLLSAWNAAIAEIRKRGGVVTCEPPNADRKFRVLGSATDIMEVPQTDLVPWEEAIMALDAKAVELEYGMCAGWKRSGTAEKVTFTDADGYEMQLRIICEAEDDKLRPVH